jgi:hypothetical protein
VFNETTIGTCTVGNCDGICLAKRVDIACGEGYGNNLLSAKATHVTGMDADAITLEKLQPNTKDNLYFVQSKAEKLLPQILNLT